MSSLTNFTKPLFETRLAQSAQDKLVLEEEGYFTPDVYFPDEAQGLWRAENMRRYIIKRGYSAEIDLDRPVLMAGNQRQSTVHLIVGRIPQEFLQDIKDFASTEERPTGCPQYYLAIRDNGVSKQTAETAMMQAFQALDGKSRQKFKPK